MDIAAPKAVSVDFMRPTGYGYRPRDEGGWYPLSGNRQNYSSTRMDKQFQRPSAITLLLVLTVLLALAATVFVTAVPFAPCPAPRHESIADYADDCPRCGDRQAITLFNKWFWRPTPEEFDRMQKPKFP